MQTESDFEQLVRKSGILFTADIGGGPEELVIAVASPGLSRTQVATQADLVAAGYIRVDALHRLEGTRERLTEALTLAHDKLARAGETERTLREQLAAAMARIAALETVKAAEQEGVIARNRGEAAETNPHAEGPRRQAWITGWRLRDVLLGLDARVKQLTEANQSLRSVHAGLEESELLANGRLGKLRSAYQRLLLEAPHDPMCACRPDGPQAVACTCWLSKYGYGALNPP